MLSAHHEIPTTNPNIYRVPATLDDILYVLSSRFVAMIFSALVKCAKIPKARPSHALLATNVGLTDQAQVQKEA